ncbi:MAG: hypothetical protein BWX88_05213 [Planctomycetes bacterium ADurb.Bin126]|nr:MAG: hypothetical protein BWX88_05213 [Planctomycetes bacterium ADurb.Bin126]
MLPTVVESLFITSIPPPTLVSVYVPPLNAPDRARYCVPPMDVLPASVIVLVIPKPPPLLPNAPHPPPTPAPLRVMPTPGGV